METVQFLTQKPLVPENTFYYGLSSAGHIFTEELFKDCYSDIGRSSIDPAFMVKVILLQFHDRVSDREAWNRAKYDLRWKFSLGLPKEEAGFHHSTFPISGPGCFCTEKTSKYLKPS